MKTLTSKWILFATLSFAFILLSLTSCTSSSAGTNQLKVSDTSLSAESKDFIVPISIDLPTEFFKVNLERYWILKSVDTGNEYTSLEKEEDIKYLVMRIKYTNTDNESRMIGQGQVLINYNGKDYNFDHSETVLGKSWGTGMEQLNPLTSATLVFVYKIPAALTGKAYFHPGRTDDHKFIEIGDVDKYTPLR